MSSDIVLFDNIKNWYNKNKPAIKETVETVVFVVVAVILIRFFGIRC